MFNVDFTFLWTAVNLLIIYLVLNKFIFKKIGVFMEKRSASIAADIENSRELMSKGDEYRRQYEEILKTANDKRKEILDEAKTRASNEYDRIVAEAKNEAVRILKEAEEERIREQERLYTELRREVTALAISAASKVIEANMDTDKNRDLVKSFLSSEEAA